MEKTGVGYLRISDDREGRALGVGRQRADITKRADRDGVRILRWYTDNDIGASSKSTKHRPDYDRMLTDARAGLVGQFIYAYSNSRLTRRPREFEDLLDIHDQTGTQYRTIVSGDDDLSTADGRMVARLKAVVDAAEAERLSERITRKLQQNAADGKHHGGSRPFGWNEDRRTVREWEAVELRAAADRLLLGESVRSIARDMTDRGVPTAQWRPPLVLKPWRDVVLRDTLLRPRIAGLREYHGEIVGPGNWEPILDEPRWRELQALLANPDRVRTPGRNGRRHWLSGVIRCGTCGELMRVGKGRAYKGTPGKPLYRCPAGEGSHVSRDKAKVDDLVRRIVLARLALPDAVDLLHPRDTSAEVAAAAARLAELEARQADAAKGYAAGQLTIAQLVAINEALAPEIEQARTAATAPPDAPAELVELTQAPDPEPVWDALSPLQQRAVVSVLLDVRVLPTRHGPVFDPDSVEITWK